MAETRAKSLKSERQAFVNQTSQSRTTCMHPETRRRKRGNQYASWVVCGVCGSRMSYTQDGRQESKGQGQDGLLQSSGGVSPNPDTGPQPDGHEGRVFK